MKVIISHENLDFDGIASMVACSKIYPEAIMVFSGKVSNDVKKFYSLYKNILPIKQASTIAIDDIEELIIVDTNSLKRIGKFKAFKKDSSSIVIYDHHMESSHDTIKDAKKIIKPYGACTSILIEEIKRKNITITSFEATLFALGIYADTNCLTLPHTKPQDAEAVAYLLTKNADLAIVNEYMEGSFGKDYNQLFLSLLLNMETIEINHYKVIVSLYKSDLYIGELGYIASKMLGLQNCDAVFLIVEMENRCYIIGRSSKEEINIPHILQEFKGGGHAGAASATIKHGDLQNIKEVVLENLHRKIKPQITAKDIMNYPVKTVKENMTVEEVNKIMLRYGHTGMPVIKDNHIIGIISRTDIDKAMIHSLSHAPVKGFMTRDVKTIESNTSLAEINDLLVKNNIGRLPVVEGKKIIGIVTRTDLLRMLHGQSHPYWYKENFQETTEETVNCKEKIKQLPKDIYYLLKTAGEVGDYLDKKVFVVGGFVRDLLLGKENLDIDLVIEGDGLLFANELHSRLGGNLIEHKEFGTACIELENGNTLDVVTSRREYYEYPAALPVVERSSIWNDLFRRDFTINCMAIQVNKDSFGRLIDYFGGLEDMRHKKIRVLYNLSFIEDPTRILRALRFASRLGFRIEDETNNFIEEAIKDGMIGKVSVDRIREEILLLLDDRYLDKNILSLLNHYNIFQALHPQLIVTDIKINKVKDIQKSIEVFSTFYKEKVNKKLIVIMELLDDLPIDEIFQVINKFVPHKSSILNIQATLEEKEHTYKILDTEDLDRYTLYNTLHKHSMEGLIFYYNNCTNGYIRHYITYYMVNLRNIKASISGKDLVDLNIKPGPTYKIIFDAILKAKVLGEIYDRRDEINYAYRLYEEIKGGRDGV
ncbi:CBS domain-containing protein [Natronincola ferrireducens]|uniref:tRNA nucleotidyltransferase (CCA-adding enzyme) n=1 Tax=Natronincola ferrireducens TaxID=393762 RepID=A0A1G9CE65_9FIRM|nr:CBS domain-containing protein [Natronincola ferrireducens]SDK49993.1 tRNA nucleotidyltransferase (CCA-adding enzyme) [Natronincola ferrireducens]